MKQVGSCWVSKIGLEEKIVEKSTSIYIYITGYLPTFASKTTENKRERELET